MNVRPPLSPKEDLAILRKKYPEGLICTNPGPCDHRVTATTRAGWSKSWPDVSEAERQARRETFVCAECRQATDQRARVATAKVQNLAAARAVSARNRRVRALPQVVSQSASGTRINSGDQGVGIVTVRSPKPGRNAVGRLPGRHGGQPRKHTTDADRQRAYRARKKADQIASADAALAVLAA